MTGWVRPLSVNAPISSTETVSLRRAATRWLSRIWPSLASAHRRAATLQTVPIAVYPERSENPIWPSVAYPCAIPTPKPRSRPRSRQSAISVLAAERIATAMLTARKGRVGARHGVVEEHHDPITRKLVERTFELTDER